MSDRGETGGVALVLLDIEGTTTPLRFVTDVLFPYARQHLRSHLEALSGTAPYDSIVDRLRAESAGARRLGEAVPSWKDDSPAATLAGAVAFVEWLMDRDRKSTALKELQGRIWNDGYERGELVGEVFPDVPAALRRWHAEGVQAGIFSSGSVLAQQLLFRHSVAGDLTGLLKWYFDTHVGPKGDPESYRRIAQTVGIAADRILFLSDIPHELDAAHAAGTETRLVIRPGNALVVSAAQYKMIENLTQLTLT